MSDPTPHPESRALAPRKRVVAREVTAAEVEAANRDAAELLPALVPPGPSDEAPPADPAVVVDPTLLGHRHRRTSHQRVYRWTQACTLIAGVGGVVGVICTLAEDILVARCVALPGLVVGIIAVVLSGRTSLAERGRGWASAAAVFAGAARALTWLQPALFGGDHSAGQPDLPPKSTTVVPRPPR